MKERSLIQPLAVGAAGGLLGTAVVRMSDVGADGAMVTGFLLGWLSCLALKYWRLPDRLPR